MIGTLLISSQSSRVCQSAVVLLKKRLYQNCFRFAQQFWSTQTQMHFAFPLSFTLINTRILSKCLNKPRATEGWISVHLELHTPNPFFYVNAMKSDLYQVFTFRQPRPQWFVYTLLAIAGVDMREGVGFGKKHSVLLLRKQQRILNTAKQRVAG